MFVRGHRVERACRFRNPFEDVFDEHPRELLKCQRERTPEMPSRRLSVNTDPKKAMAIDAFFRKACAKDPERRFAAARTMQQALAQVGRDA